MTVASEISRLQTAKACLKASIEAKWVSVGSNLTLEDYYACVDAIQTWPKTWYIDLLVVWGWGNWWYAHRSTGWGWGWGWVIVCPSLPLSQEDTCHIVTVWAWATDTCFDNIIATKWGEWQILYWTACVNWASWWWWTGWCAYWIWSTWCNGGTWSWWNVNNSAWWWWWAWTPWCNWAWQVWWNWWDWIANDYSWECRYYWWWWGWGSIAWNWWTWWLWWWWAWAVGNNSWWWAATYYWWGWGWAGSNWDNRPWWWWWYQWVVILRYHTDWSDWLLPSSTWWCRYSCWEYTIHCFTNIWASEVFTPVFK